MNLLSALPLKVCHIQTVSRVVGASARLQGAELIRVDEARRLAKKASAFPSLERWLYNLMRIETCEVRDG